MSSSPCGAPATEVRGRTVPRIFTPPLITGPPGPCGCGCALTPGTSMGFAVDEWAREVLHRPLRPWQRWALIHGLELLPDRRPRFRTLVVLVARQQGKTTMLAALVSFWQFVQAVPLVLGTSTKLDYAKEAWDRTCELIESAPALTELRGKRWRREANGEQVSWSAERARYKIAPANAEGGRGLTVHRLILDELRQHHSYDAWNATVNAGVDVADFQCWCLSNAGTARSVVLNELVAAAEADIAAAAPADPRTGLFSWSCPPGADPADLAALAYANPQLGDTTDPEVLLAAARRALAAGGELLTGFRVETMCITEQVSDPAIDPASWQRAARPGTLAAAAGRIAACLDVTPDLAHASLVVAALVDDGDEQRVRIEVVAAWDDLAVCRAELPDWIARVRPYALGWFPGGPAASLDADLRDRRKTGRRGWPPRGVRVAELSAAAPAVCMGFAALVAAGGVVHSGQDLLDAHVHAAEKRTRGEGWVFDRRAGAAAHVDAAYAAAGAAHLVRTVPPRRPSTTLHVVPG